MSFKIKFTNYGRGVEEGTYVYRSETPILESALPEPISTLGVGATEFVDATAVYGKMYYYRFGTFAGGTILLTKNIAMRVISAHDTGPGNQKLTAGDWDFGFFGWVASAEFLPYATLRAQCGISVLGGADVGWLKMACRGEVLYVAHGPVSISISYRELYDKGLVYGTNDNGLCIPTGSVAKNQYSPFEIGDFTFVPRIWKAHNDGSDLLPVLNAGISDTTYLSGVSRPATPQTNDTEFDRIFSSFTQKPMYPGDPHVGKFGSYGYDFYKLDSYSDAARNRQSDICQQPSGTVNKANVNTRGCSLGANSVNNAIPAGYGTGLMAVTDTKLPNGQIVGGGTHTTYTAWRPILTLV